MRPDGDPRCTARDRWFWVRWYALRVPHCWPHAVAARLVSRNREWMHYELRLVREEWLSALREWAQALAAELWRDIREALAEDWRASK